MMEKIQKRIDELLEQSKFLHQRFFEEWIPMENRNFDTFQIQKSCNLII